jgi:Ca2+-binding RTX toxin-like protein
MPTTIVTTDNFAAGTLYAPVTGDTLIIAAGVSVGSTDDVTIEMQGGARLQVFGMVYQNEDFIAVQSAASASTSISIMAGGGVVTRGTNDPAILQQGGMLNNAGLVQCDLDRAILAWGDTRITNSGTIQAGRDGIYVFFGGTGGSVVNDGVIRAGLLAGSDGDGISIARSGVQVLNTGQISTQSVGAAGISVGETFFSGFASDVGIVNHGTISAASGYGVSAINNSSFGIEVLNTGTITGGITAVQGGLGADVISNFGTLAGGFSYAMAVELLEGGDTLVNAGIIHGAVLMGIDDDEYLGRDSRTGAVVNGEGGNDRLTGGAFDDSLYGGSEDDFAMGNAGSDVLTGGDGSDTLLGGVDDDYLYGGTGADDLYGGLGDDTFTGGTGADTLWGMAGDDVMLGGDGDDTFMISSLDDVVVESSTAVASLADVVTSGAISLNLSLFANVERAVLTGTRGLSLTGNDGANGLTGNAAGNRLAGGLGADTIVGGGGADIITGGAGRDLMTGGAGADVFVWLSAAETGLTAGTRDQITDFVAGTDDMRMVFMGSFIGAAGFTGVGQVRYVAATGLLTGNTDADASAEWSAQMATGLTLTSGDFVF